MKWFRVVAFLLAFSLVAGTFQQSYAFASDNYELTYNNSELTYDNSQITADNEVNFIINGTPVRFGIEDNDLKPYVKDGIVMIPFRKVFENFDMKITWDPVYNVVSAQNDSLSMDLSVGNKVACVNGMLKELDVAIEMNKDRIFVPLNFLSENCGIDVDWDGSKRALILNDATVSKAEDISKDIPALDEIPSADLQSKAKTSKDISKESPKKKKTKKTKYESVDIQETDEDIIDDYQTTSPVDEDEDAVETTDMDAVPNTDSFETEGVIIDQNQVEENTESQDYFTEKDILIKSMSDGNYIFDKEFNIDNNELDVILVDLNGVEDKYKIDTALSIKYLNQAIRKSDREFDIERAIELVEKSKDLTLMNTVKENIYMDNIDGNYAIQRLEDFIYQRIGLKLSDEVRNQIYASINFAFDNKKVVWKDKDGIGDLAWTKEKKEMGEGKYVKMYLAIKDTDSEDILYIVPLSLYITCTKYKKTKYFGLKKKTKYSSNIYVEALKISKVLKAIE